jgi:hypothetical protein
MTHLAPPRRQLSRASTPINAVNLSNAVNNTAVSSNFYREKTIFRVVPA